ncbi:MAG: hypothetical protein HOP22_16690 [Nitrospiraceae bacterium]|nr:hypothetical protein [Nitrospiraceae bacterium]
MQRWKLLWAAVLMVIAVGANSGCIMYREGDLPPITQWPPVVKQTKPTISLIVTGQAILNGSVKEGSGDYYLEEWRRDTVRAYQDSGLFSEVRQTAVESDLRAEIRILDKTESSPVMGFITGFTLFLVPSSVTETMTVTTALKDRKGTTLGSFEKSERLTTWVELFLAFAMPFRSMDHLSIYDLNRATIVDARASKGVL